MLTIKCSLKFADGVQVSGEMTASSPEVNYWVHYIGPVERLSKLFEKCDAGFLEFIFKQMATETGAELSITKDGEYDSWAE